MLAETSHVADVTTSKTPGLAVWGPGRWAVAGARCRSGAVSGRWTSVARSSLANLDIKRSCPLSTCAMASLSGDWGGGAFGETEPMSILTPAVVVDPRDGGIQGDRVGIFSHLDGDRRRSQSPRICLNHQSMLIGISGRDRKGGIRQITESAFVRRISLVGRLAHLLERVAKSGGLVYIEEVIDYLCAYLRPWNGISHNIVSVNHFRYGAFNLLAEGTCNCRRDNFNYGRMANASKCKINVL